MGLIKNIGRKVKNTAKKVGKESKKVVKTTGRVTKNTAKKVGRGTKKVAKTTGRVTKNAAKKVGKGTKKVAKTTGRVTKNTAKKVGKGTKKVAKSTGRVTKNTAKKVGKGTKKVAKSTGRVTKNTAKKVGKGTKKVAKTTGRVTKNTAIKVGKETKKVVKTTGRVVRRYARRVLKISDFKLNVHFVIAHSKADFPDKDVEQWIDDRLQIAEQQFAMNPSLKFGKVSFSRTTKAPLNKRFTKGFDYQKFMNTHFDNKSKLITKGELLFLVVDQWAVSSKAFKKGEMKNLCGKAFFPLYPEWKKHAIILQKSCKAYVFSHELGHIFGLKHTFVKGLCTRKYEKGEKGKSTTYNNGSMNLMDYRTNLSSAQINKLNRFTLNDCQERRAALARRRYMTIGGKTNYLKLKGVL